MSSIHVSVLKKEALEYLSVGPDRNFLDVTINGGGHAEAILEASGPTGRLIGLDADPAAVEVSRSRLRGFGSRLELVQKNFRLLSSLKIDFQVDGILADLGWSVNQLQANRGFSFNDSGQLDMRYDQRQPLTAETIIMSWTEERLTKLFRDYGELRPASILAQAVVKWRKGFEGRSPEVVDFVGLVTSVIRKKNRLHPATQVFQALRLAVNDELNALTDFLPQAVQTLRPGGRLVVITFQSLEDRLVKNFFRNESVDCLCPKELPTCVCQHKASLKIITKKTIRPGRDEVLQNPRSRSAKLRAAEKL